MSTLYKECFKCNTEKPLSEFYKHKEMADGHLNKCKECAKSDVHSHRKDNIEKVRQYDRNRPNSKERSKRLSEKIKNLPKDRKEEYYKKKNEYMQSGAYKNKKTVNIYMANAVRDGRLKKLDHCEHCNAKDVPLDGHHHDYLKPLDVTWLCKPCHGAEHKRLNALKRGVA